MHNTQRTGNGNRFIELCNAVVALGSELQAQGLQLVFQFCPLQRVSLDQSCNLALFIRVITRAGSVDFLFELSETVIDDDFQVGADLFPLVVDRVFHKTIENLYAIDRVWISQLKPYERAQRISLFRIWLSQVDGITVKYLKTLFKRDTVFFKRFEQFLMVTEKVQARVIRLKRRPHFKQGLFRRQLIDLRSIESIEFVDCGGTQNAARQVDRLREQCIGQSNPTRYNRGGSNQLFLFPVRVEQVKQVNISV